jgi:glycosyltransferase involved in cell wall biosynthesis
MVSVVENGVTGYVDTRVERVVDALRALVGDPAEARRLGEAGRRRARERFAIGRFARDWDDAFRFATTASPARARRSRETDAEVPA